MSPAPGGLAEARDEAARAALIEAGRVLFAGDCAFVHAAQTLDQLPPPRGPEVAFAGRSNVGKSSLLNALTGRRALARVSATPGRTRQLNFFDLAGRLTLVDMPGYGYAQAPGDVRRAWEGLAGRYLQDRPALCGAVLMVDIRRSFTDLDRRLLGWLPPTLPLLVLLTKSDKLGTAQQTAARRTALAELAEAHPRTGPTAVLLFSAQTRKGVDEARALIEGWFADAAANAGLPTTTPQPIEEDPHEPR